MWKLPNGKVQRVPKGIRVGDVNYPASIFRRWSKEELNAIGIYPYREVGFDQKWFKSTGSTEEEVDGEIVKTHTTTKRYTNAEAKDLRTDQVREQYISEIGRAKQNEDFYDAVGDSGSKKIWGDYVTALKNDAKTLKDQVSAAGSYDAIVNLKFNWTSAPDSEEVVDGTV